MNMHLVNRVEERGFTLVELISVMILVGILSVVFLPRLAYINTAAVQGSRDDLIAALFFAQQASMARSSPSRTIRLQTTATQVTVTESVTSPSVSTKTIYSVSMHRGATLSIATLNYDKLGRTNAQNITVTGSGNSAGVTAVVRVEGSGYAFAN